LNALSLIIVAHVIRGFDVSSFTTALIAALVIGLVNATVGWILKILTLPLTLLTLGVFWFVINALMLKLASAFVPGFTIRGFLPAFFGEIVLSLVNLLLKAIANFMRRDFEGDRR
jgi:putative membrane protein